MNLLKTIAVLVAIAVVLAAPWPIGGNLPYVRTVFLLVAALLVILAIGLRLSKTTFQSLSLVWLLIPIGVAYAIYQTLPIGPEGSAISIYPTASEAVLCTLASAVGFFLASTAIFQHRRMIQPVMFAATIVGVAVAFVGIAQNLAGNGKVLWNYDLLFGGVPFGPFVNKNNGAGFLVACASGAIFFLAIQILDWRKANRPEGFSLADELPSKKGFPNPFTALLSLFAGLETKHLYSLAALIIIVAGVALSLSRGGSVSILVALMLAIAMVSISNRWVLALALLITVGCISLAVYVEQADAVASRMATLTEVDEDSSPRLLHWQDAMPYYQEYWQKGSGLGTYQYVYPEFQDVPFKGKFAHAENVYLETLAELGIVGLVTLCLTVLVIFYHSVRLFWRKQSFDQALGIAGAFCITGQAFCAALDFGMYQPANFAVTAIILGCVVGRATTLVDGPSKDKKRGWWQRAVAIAVLGSIAIGCGYSVLPSYSIESVRKAKRSIRRHKTSQGHDVRALERAKRLLVDAEKVRPDDWEIAYYLGETHLYEHRQQLTDIVIEDVRKEETRMLTEQAAKSVPPGVAPPEVERPLVVRDESSDIESTLPTREEYWATSSENNLHRMLRLTERSNPQEFLALRKDPNLITPDLQKAKEYFDRAGEKFDRNIKSVYRKAQLSVVFDPPESSKEIEANHIERILKLTKGNANMSFACGLLALHSGDQSLAVDLWADCLSKSRRYEMQIVQFSMEQLPLKPFFEKVLPQNPHELLKISRKYFSSSDLALPNKLLLVHTKRLINEQVDDPKEKSALLANVHFRSAEYAEAVDNFRQALEADPSQVELRMDFAKSLQAIGAYDEAIKELKICELESPNQRTKISRLIKAVQRERAKPAVKDSDEQPESESANNKWSSQLQSSTQQNELEQSNEAPQEKTPPQDQPPQDK